jgi:hypothetical protein
LNEKTKAAEVLLTEGKELESGLNVNGAEGDEQGEDDEMDGVETEEKGVEEEKVD